MDPLGCRPVMPKELAIRLAPPFVRVVDNPLEAVVGGAAIPNGALQLFVSFGIKFKLRSRTALRYVWPTTASGAPGVWSWVVKSVS